MTLTEMLMEKLYEEVTPEEQYGAIPYDDEKDTRKYWDAPYASTSPTSKCVCTKSNDLGADDRGRD
jgi:hypothetical protein